MHRRSKLIKIRFPELLRQQGREGKGCSQQLQGRGRRQEGRSSYKEMTRPLGGIQDADHLQLGSQLQAAPSARSDHECARIGALAGTSS